MRGWLTSTTRMIQSFKHLPYLYFQPIYAFFTPLSSLVLLVYRLNNPQRLIAA